MWENAGHAGGCAQGRQRVLGKSLSSLLNFAMNIRLLKKKKKLKAIKNKN